jgi:hypothetical protein
MKINGFLEKTRGFKVEEFNQCGRRNLFFLFLFMFSLAKFYKKFDDKFLQQFFQKI